MKDEALIAGGILRSAISIASLTLSIRREIRALRRIYTWRCAS